MSIATQPTVVKGPPSADRRDGRKRRPDVLKRMRPSCVKVWDVLFAKAQGEAIQISLRELSQLTGVSYTHVRRCLVELERVHLIKWRPGERGRGHKSVIEVLWRSYPAKKDPPIEKLRKNRGTPLQFGGSQHESFKNGGRPTLERYSPKIKNKEKSSHSDIHRCPLEVELSQLKRPVSEKGRRWALAKIRESLKASGTPYRRKIMAAIAPPLTRAIKKNRIRDGYELNRVVRRIADMLDEGEFRASRLCDKAIAARFTGTWRPLYAAASALVARAVAEVERDRRELENTEALLEQYRKDWEEWHREEMRRELELREWLGEEVQFPKKLSPKEGPPTCPEVGWPDEPNGGFPEQSPATKQPPMAKRSSVEEHSLITEGLEAAKRTLAVGAVSEDPAAELTLSPHRAEIEGEAFGPACSGFVWSGGGSTEGYWVLGGRKRATRAQPKRVTREERVRQLREEARCGDPEREALARAILRRLRSKVAI